MNHLHFKEIRLKNFATFEDQTFKFNSSFNCIIGETGSGKSLVAEALQIILGARGDRSYIRKNTDFCVLEAELHCKDDSVKSYLEDKGYPFENDSIYIKRIINSDSPNKSFINGSYCSSTILRDFSRRHIDLVGQFQNQKLLSSNYQLKLLDFFVDFKLLKNYSSKYEELVSLKEKLEETKLAFAEISEQKDFIEYQVNELSQVLSLIEEEENLLKQKEDIIENQNKSKVEQQINELISSEQGLENNLNLLEKLLSSYPDLHNQFAENFNSFKSFLTDLSYSISKNMGEYNEEDLDKVLDSLDKIQKLKRKHNCTTEELQGKYQALNSKLDLAKDFELNIIKIQDSIKDIENSCFTIADKIHTQRAKVSKNISDKLNTHLQNLNMKGCQINIKLTKGESLSSRGISSLKFLIQTNLGEGFHELSKTASGGELSRVLLCFRQVIASKDSISVFFFDEIDTGIGGQTALKIGAALADIAEKSQVIAITHLPQIAQYTNLLIDVHKTQKKEKKEVRTISQIKTYKDSELNQKVREMIPLGF